MIIAYILHSSGVWLSQYSLWVILPGLVYFGIRASVPIVLEIMSYDERLEHAVIYAFVIGVINISMMVGSVFLLDNTFLPGAMMCAGIIEIFILKKAASRWMYDK